MGTKFFFTRHNPVGIISCYCKRCKKRQKRGLMYVGGTCDYCGYQGFKKESASKQMRDIIKHLEKGGNNV